MFEIGCEEEHESFFDIVKDVGEKYGVSQDRRAHNFDHRNMEETVRSGTHRVRPPRPVRFSRPSDDVRTEVEIISDEISADESRVDDENTRRVDGLEERNESNNAAERLNYDVSLHVEGSETVAVSSGSQPDSGDVSPSPADSCLVPNARELSSAVDREEAEFTRFMSGFDEARNGELMSSNDCTRLLANSSTSSGVYNGLGGAVDDCVASEIGFDRFLLPIREDGVFKEGKKKTRAAKELVIHPREILSHAYLRTSEEGVLHVLPGWDHKTFMSDYSYRFHASHTQQKVQVPFLSNVLCTVRTFNCLGVYVCPKCPEDLKKSCHVDVHEEDKNILDSLDDEEDENGAKKRIQGIYRDIRSRRRFCNAMRVGSRGTVEVCGGHAIVKESHNPASRNKFFLGCSGFKKEEQGHYARSLPYPDEYVNYLKRFISGEDNIPQESASCMHVMGKRKRKTCPRHGRRDDLVEVTCMNESDDPQPCHTMCTFEPVGYDAETKLRHKILYVSCIDVHMHPAPPPPETTVTKLRLVQYVYETMNVRDLGQLKFEVQRLLVEAKKKGEKGASKFDGSIILPDGSMRRRLERLRPKLPILAKEVGALGQLVTNPEIPYVRDCKMLENVYIYFLVYNELLMHASKMLMFAGDATYKTVTEKTRSVRKGRWYLYNIVTFASRNRLNRKGVVVLRALMTSLSKEFYYAVWKYFFETKARASNALRAAEDLDSGSIRVPYMDIAPPLQTRTSLVSSITMDFDVAEIHGCAEALRSVTGGTVQLHLDHIFIGCSVHLFQDIISHSREAERQRKAKMSGDELLKMYIAYRDAPTSEAADIAFKKIKESDLEWAKWVEKAGISALIVKSLSKMSDSARADGFDDTNIVESHNRRGNHYIGTHNSPQEAAIKLADLDATDREKLNRGVFEEIINARGKRNRSASILCPSAAGSDSGTKKRSKTGGGPVQEKRRSSARKRQEKGPAQKVGVMEISETRDNGCGKSSSHASAAENELVENVIEKLAELEDQLDSLDEEDTSAAERERRMDILVKLVADVHDVGSSLDVEGSGTAVSRIYKILLDAIGTLQKDASFRKALFKLMRECKKAPASASRGASEENRQA